MTRFRLFNHDKESAPVGQGVLAGLMEVCYIALVAIFMVGSQSFLSNKTDTPWVTVFGIICLLSLLVLSVGVSGLLVFGWPAHYFMERKYNEAIASIGATVATMFVIFAIIFIGASLVSLIGF